MPIIREYKGLSLIFSLDDNGYYWQEFFEGKSRTSQVFKTEQEAMSSFNRGEIKWDN